MSTSIAAPPETIVTPHLEPPDARRARLSTSVLILVMGVFLIGLFPSSGPTANFALSNAFDTVQLPTIALPAGPVVLATALLCLVAGAGLISGKLSRPLRRLAGAVAGLSLVLGFLSWAAASSSLPFPVSNQLAGTLALATPLVLGSLAGVIGERAGVVNVAIEGQFLNAAFAAAVVGSVTQSIPAALFAAVLASVVTAALLALFAI